MWSAADWAIHGPCTLCMHSTSQLLPKEECERSSLLKVLVWTFVYMHETFQCFMEIHIFHDSVRIHSSLLLTVFSHMLLDHQCSCRLGISLFLHANFPGELRIAKTGAGEHLREFCLGWGPAIEGYLSGRNSNATPQMSANPED